MLRYYKILVFCIQIINKKHIYNKNSFILYVINIWNLLITPRFSANKNMPKTVPSLLLLNQWNSYNSKDSQKALVRKKIVYWNWLEIAVMLLLEFLLSIKLAIETMMYHRPMDNSKAQNRCLYLFSGRLSIIYPNTIKLKIWTCTVSFEDVPAIRFIKFPISIKPIK